MTSLFKISNDVGPTNMLRTKFKIALEVIYRIVI